MDLSLAYDLESPNCTLPPGSIYIRTDHELAFLVEYAIIIIVVLGHLLGSIPPPIVAERMPNKRVHVASYLGRMIEFSCVLRSAAVSRVFLLYIIPLKVFHPLAGNICLSAPSRSISTVC